MHITWRMRSWYCYLIKRSPVWWYSALGVTSVALVGIWFVVIQYPLQTTYTVCTAQCAGLEKEVARLAQQSHQEPTLHHVGDRPWLHSTPSHVRVQNVLREVHTSGLHLTQYQPAERKEKKGYVRTTNTLSCTGSFDALLAFLDVMARSQNMVAVKELHLASDADGELTIEMQVDCYEMFTNAVSS